MERKREEFDRLGERRRALAMPEGDAVAKAAVPMAFRAFAGTATPRPAQAGTSNKVYKPRPGRAHLGELFQYPAVRREVVLLQQRTAIEGEEMGPVMETLPANYLTHGG